MSDNLYVSYLPDPGVEPRGTFGPSAIPAIYLTRQYDGLDLRIQFDPNDPAETIRYLRELAAVAADLADQVEKAADDEYATAEVAKR